MAWKLIRDNLPECARQKGELMVCHFAKNPAERRHHLRKKLNEEVKEFLESEDPMELADILEVIGAIAGEKGISMRQLYRMRDKKRNEKGGFEMGIIWEGKTI